MLIEPHGLPYKQSPICRQEQRVSPVKGELAHRKVGGNETCQKPFVYVHLLHLKLNELFKTLSLYGHKAEVRAGRAIIQTHGDPYSITYDLLSYLLASLGVYFPFNYIYCMYA